MSNKKTFIRLVDTHTREIVGEGELTPARVKALIRAYKVAGLWVEVA